VTGYTVDPGALYVTAESVQAVLDELGNLGLNGEQESGSPIENVALSSDDMGSEALAAITADALLRAHYALRTALHNGGQLVSALGNIRASYLRAESQVSNLFGQIHHALSTATNRLSTGSVASRPSVGQLANPASGGQG
jgi:hypothetical protein